MSGIAFRDVHGIADELGVDVQTVRRWIQSGKLKAFKPGKEYRIRQADLEEFLAAREVRPKAQAPPSPEQPDFNGLLEEERRSTLTQLFEDVRTLIVNAADRWTHAAETGLMFSSEDAALTYSLEINAEAAQLYGFVAEGLEPALEGLLSGTLTLRDEQRKLWEAMEQLTKAVKAANAAADAVAPPREPTDEDWAAAGPILDAIWEEMDEVKQHRLLREFAEEMAAECEQAAADRRGRIGA